MFQTIPVTKLLKEPRKIYEKVKKGESFTVLSRSEPIFNIVPLSKEDKTINRDLKIPTLDISLPDEIRTKDIYEKYSK